MQTTDTTVYEIQPPMCVPCGLHVEHSDISLMPVSEIPRSTCLSAVCLVSSSMPVIARVTLHDDTYVSLRRRIIAILNLSPRTR